MERKKIVRIAMKITEAIIGILKQEFGEKDENKRSKAKKVRKDSRTSAFSTIKGDHNGQSEGR